MHNNMFKKALSLVLATALIVSVCSGCSKKPDDTPEATEKPRQAVYKLTEAPQTNAETHKKNNTPQTNIS